MELDSLKDIWQTQDTPAPTRKEEMLALLQRKSRGPVARMQYNLTRELAIVIITYVPAILFLLLSSHGQFWGIALLLFLLGAFFGVYYYYKQRLLKSMLCVSCEVRSNLARQVTILKRYVRFYLIAGTAMLPLTALFTWLVLDYKLNAVHSSKGFHTGQFFALYHNPMVWLLLIIPLTVAFYHVNVWYIHKLYGKHIKNLEKMLWEMNTE